MIQRVKRRGAGAATSAASVRALLDGIVRADLLRYLDT
jgi:hypothetical protein